jgi:hypothetical protein
VGNLKKQTCELLVFFFLWLQPLEQVSHTYLCLSAGDKLESQTYKFQFILLHFINFPHPQLISFIRKKISERLFARAWLMREYGDCASEPWPQHNLVPPAVLWSPFKECYF